MKIVKLTAENIKRLTAVEITPDGNVVQITGANGSGKSSVLDAIFYALGGKGAIPSAPVRRGASHALVELDLGDMIVKRRFDADGSTALQVESKDGASYKSPQTLLDAMLGRMTFDPLEFLRLKPREQLDMLRSVVTVDVDLEKLDGQNRADFDRRTEINRDEKKLRAEADGIIVEPDLPATPIDVSALMGELEAAAEHNASIETRRVRRADVQRQINAAQAIGLELRTRADALRKEAAELDVRAAHAEKQRDDLQARLDSAEALPEPIDVALVRTKIESAQAVNKGIELRTRKATLRAQADGMKKAADLLTAAIEARKNERDEAIARADMPVPGLGFGDGEVLFNDLPFSQASGAEQLRTSLAIAMAANPKLRIVRIKDGSLLDENGIKLVAEMAAARDFQVWLECVDTSGTVGVEMRDGAVHAVHPVGEP
jgi:DNA repair exonuclease SbcCD ATPase subunit